MHYHQPLCKVGLGVIRALIKPETWPTSSPGFALSIVLSGNLQDGSIISFESR